MEYAEEREQGKRGQKREMKREMKRSRATGTAILFLVVIGCLISGRLFFAEVRGFLGAGDFEILSEEEETSDVLVPGEIPLYLQKDRRWRKEKFETVQ